MRRAALVAAVGILFALVAFLSAVTEGSVADRSSTAAVTTVLPSSTVVDGSVLLVFESDCTTMPCPEGLTIGSRQYVNPRDDKACTRVDEPTADYAVPVEASSSVIVRVDSIVGIDPELAVVAVLPRSACGKNPRNPTQLRNTIMTRVVSVPAPIEIAEQDLVDLYVEAARTLNPCPRPGEVYINGQYFGGPLQGEAIPEPIRSAIASAIPCGSYFSDSDAEFVPFDDVMVSFGSVRRPRDDLFLFLRGTHVCGTCGQWEEEPYLWTGEEWQPVIPVIAGVDVTSAIS